MFLQSGGTAQKNVLYQMDHKISVISKHPIVYDAVTVYRLKKDVLF
jgi:hypothetical protein